MSILPANDPFSLDSLTGNALIVQSPRGGVQSEVTVEWVDNLHLNVFKSRDAEIFKAESSLNGVTIGYGDPGAGGSNAK